MGFHFSTLHKLACAVLLIFLLSIVAAGPHYRKAFRPATLYFQGKQRYDSWQPMERALTYLRTEYRAGGGLLYQTLFFERNLKFQYPPTSLIVFETLAKLTPRALDLQRALTYAFIPLTAVLLALIFRHADGSRSWYDITLLAAALTLLFYPVLRAMNLGQIQVWLNAFFALLFYCWLRGWERAAGVLLGIMCLFKPPYGLLLLWGLARRRWGFAIAATVTLAVGGVISIGMFGLANNLDYLSVVSYLSHHGESFYPNQSMNGLLNRLLFNAPALKWQGGAFPPFHPVVYYGTMLFAAALVVAAFVLPRRSGKSGSALDLSIMAITATVTSPIAWEHHYGVMLPIFLYAFVQVVHARRYALLALLAASYTLCSCFIPSLSDLAEHRLWNFTASYVFFGGLLLLGVVYLLLGREKTEGAELRQGEQYG